MVLKSSDFESYMNQAKVTIRKTGPNRIRSMELLKQIFNTMNKHFTPPGPAREAAVEKAGEDKSERDQIYTGESILSVSLRKHVTETMFYMLKTFPFCSISHQQAIMIMTGLKESYDLGDLQVLK